MRAATRPLTRVCIATRPLIRTRSATKPLNTHPYLRACLHMSSIRVLQLLQYACCSCCSCCVCESMPRHVLNTRLRTPALQRRQLFASIPLRASSRLYTLTRLLSPDACVHQRCDADSSSPLYPFTRLLPPAYPSLCPYAPPRASIR